MLKENDPAPLDVKVTDQDGNEFSLREMLGHKVVVYFYPKDDTPGCTKEACGIRDSWAGFAQKGVKVFGVSPDSGNSHLKFISKYELPFPLLADEQHQLAEAFGAWGEKKMYGKTYMGIMRSTFIINEEGVIQKAYPKVKPAEHAEQLLKEFN